MTAMDAVVAVKPCKPSSNVSDIVHGFAKVCRLRSFGVFSNENPNNPNRSESTEEGEYQKIHPHPFEEDKLVKVKKIRVDGSVDYALMSKLFDTVSALKLTYIHLQEAHCPYNPEEIQSADDLIVSKLKTLVDIKKSYKNLAKPRKSNSGPLLLDLIQAHRRQLEKLQAQIQTKDCEIERLRHDVEELGLKNNELEEKIKKRALEEEMCRIMTMGSFSDAFEAASKAIHDFAKPLISLMKASGWDLDLATKSIEDSVIYSKRSHKKFAFEAYISRRMFQGFHELPLQSNDVEDIAKYYKDPLDLLIRDPDSNFAKFCREKYLMVVHSKMEASFFRNLDHRRLVKQGKHPRTMFYQMFAKMAKCVWLLRLIGASIEPKAEVFGVLSGSEFSEVYMENVVGDESCEGSSGRLNVGFMLMPGFKIGCNVIKARVYATKCSVKC